MYSFQDTGHFFSYYDELRALYDYDLQTFDSVVYDGRTIPTVYNKIRFDSFYNENDMYKPFLSDPIMQSFANEHFEFKIGNSLVTYLNNATVVLSDYSNSATTTALRNLPKGGPISADQLPDDVKWGPDTEQSGFWWWFENNGPLCGCDIRIERLGCDCIRVWGNCNNLLHKDAGGELIIEIFDEFGDPVPLEGIEMDVDGAYEAELCDLDRFTGGFGQDNDLRIEARIDPDCTLGSTKEDELDVDLDEEVCDLRERETPWTLADDGADQGMQYRTTFYRNHRNAISEVTVHAKWRNGPNSRWKRQDNADLWVNIEETRLDGWSANCNFIENDNQAKSCTDCESIKADVKFGWFREQSRVSHCDGDVIGHVRKDIGPWNGQTWNIDVDDPIDFECCNN